MSARGRGGAPRYQSTGSENEGREVELGKRKRKPRNKKHIQEKRFVIHPDSLRATRSELYQAQTDITCCTTIPIDDSKSEREIREILVAKLPKLHGKRFQFLTKVETRNHFCPCSHTCLDATHVENPISEWNGKNVKKMARGNRVVYILCLCKETAMTGGHDDGTSSFDSTQAENVIPQNVASGGTNVGTSGTARETLLPQSACKDNVTEEISSLVDTITLRVHNQTITRNDGDDNDDADDGNSDDDDDDDEDESEEEREESLPLPPATQLQRHTDVESLVENPSMNNPETESNGGCQMELESAYNTLPTGSNTSLYTLDSTHQSQLAFLSPLNTPTETAGSWRNQGSNTSLSTLDSTHQSQGITMEETSSGGVQSDSPTDQVFSDPQFYGWGNPLHHEEATIVVNQRSCPDLPLCGLEYQENTSMPPQWLTQFTQLSQEKSLLETAYEKVTEEKEMTEEEQEEKDEGDDEMQRDMKNGVASVSENVFPRRQVESGYDTISSENSATFHPVDRVNSVEDEVAQNSPMLVMNFNGCTSLFPAPTEMEMFLAERIRTQLEMEEIVPDKGDVAGGYTFFLRLADICAVRHDFKVQFGPSTDPIPVTRLSNNVFMGKVPPSSSSGVVQVYLVNVLGEAISNTSSFEYIDPNKAKEDFVEKGIHTPEDLQKMLILLSKKLGKMNLNDTKETNSQGGGKTQALSLLYMIADTAAKLNAIDFFRIIFSTHVGKSVFKSLRDAQVPLEAIARGYGHKELAQLLQQKHSMYQDYENESDDEVDWKELAKAIEKYQTMNGETTEKKSIPSTSSSENVQGYLGDGESFTSLSSVHLLDVKGCNGSTFEEQQVTPKPMCGEEPDTCSTTAAESCPESTFEEQQTTPESSCREESDTCQKTAAESSPENTLEEQKTTLKSTCGEKPDTCQMSDITNTISSGKLRMEKAHKIKDRKSSVGEKSLLANSYSNPLHLVGIGKTDKFAPKVEVWNLGNKLQSSIFSSFYPDGDRTICNLMKRSDTPSDVGFLKEPKQVALKRGLKADKDRWHPETAKEQLYGTMRKGTEALESAVLVSSRSQCFSLEDIRRMNFQILPKKHREAVERALSKHLPWKVRDTNGKYVKVPKETTRACDKESPSEPNSSHQVSHFVEHSSKIKKNLVRFCSALLMVSIVLIVIGFVFWSQAKKTAETGTTRASSSVTTPAVMTTKQACTIGLSTLHCEAARNVNTVRLVQWKIKYPGNGWIKFSHCNKYSKNCIVTRSVLPEGIRVLKVSNGTVTLQRTAENNTDAYVSFLCEVHYLNSSVTHVYEVSFTARCVWIQEGRTVNLSRISSKMFPCEHVVSIEWYLPDKRMFANCNSCQVCEKTSDGNHPMPVFWNQLQVSKGLLYLTAFKKNDDGFTAQIIVRKASLMRHDTAPDMESVHVYTLWIFVNRSINTGDPPATMMPSKRQAYSESGLLILHCKEPARRIKIEDIEDLEWRILVPAKKWMTFGYCGHHESRFNCLVTRSMLQEGVKIRKISNGTLTLQRIAENSTFHNLRAACIVHGHLNLLAAHFYDVEFTKKPLLIQEGLDVNLTAYLLNLERCEHVAEIEWYNDHGCKFANCNSCHYCEETPDANNLASVFRNRLQYTRGSLLLTGIQGSDDGLKIRIKVSMKASRGMVAVAKSIHVYTLLLFVYTVSPVARAQTAYFCQDYKIKIRDPVTRSFQCHDCLRCPAGQGLSIPCGTVISTETPVGCKPCVLGETYSSEYDSGACKDCMNCGPYRETNKPCTLTSVAKCGSCTPGTYTEPLLGMCFPCSPCCNDSKDIFVPECKVAGVPTNMQCSILRSMKCSKMMTSTLPPLTIKKNSLPLSFDGHEKPHRPLLIIGGFVFSLSMILLFSLLHKVYCRRCKFEMDSGKWYKENLKAIPKVTNVNGSPTRCKPDVSSLENGASLSVVYSRI